jgi:hypothetical protein
VVEHWLDRTVPQSCIRGILSSPAKLSGRKLRTEVQEDRYVLQKRSPAARRSTPLLTGTPPTSVASVTELVVTVAARVNVRKEVATTVVTKEAA